jgi:two-component system, NarL family, nitrate/nitrite response regulator NarL
VIELAAVEDNRLLIDGLRAWARTLPDIRLAAVHPTVDGLLRAVSADHDVVLLNPVLRADPDPALNVGRLFEAGHRVLVIDGTADLAMVARSLAAGAHGYLTRDHDGPALARTIRQIAAGGSAWTRGPTRAPGARGPGRPPLSEREHRVLMAYVSGLTLDATARSLGISPETARTYLKRLKAKYQQAGLPVYTKLDLAQQVRADCTAGSCHAPQTQAGVDDRSRGRALRQDAEGGHPPELDGQRPPRNLRLAGIGHWLQLRNG